MNGIHLADFVRESNRIEGIHRDLTDAEFRAHVDFVWLPQVHIRDLESFVEVVAPGKKLRVQPGMNVRVGNHIAPEGGPDIEKALGAILDMANRRVEDPWRVHCDYEVLHPFMDGNGRSGRVLWLWMMMRESGAPLGFLHSFYYQTLANYRRTE